MNLINIGDISEIGNKAYNLIIMQEQNINVPKSEYLTDQICREIALLHKESKLNENINYYLDKINFFQFERRVSYPLIIRSSSANEDNKNQSNAGKYLSIYNIFNRRDLVNSIIKCWNSKEKDENMGIIIQEQLFPYYSGVSFIYSNSGRKELIIELVIGLGELLVSGFVSPMRYKYDFENDSFIILQSSSQKIAEFPMKDNEQIMPTDDKKILNKIFRVLNIGNNIFYAYLAYKMDYFYKLEEVLYRIKDECLKIHNFIGDSDIEWVYTIEDDLYIVQRRPITRAVSDLEENNNQSEYGGATVVPGIRRGKLVHLENYNGEKNCIVFAPTILPKDFTLLMKSNGIISIECSLLSHSSILARELQLPYWAGVSNQLYNDYKNQIVLVDYLNKTIKLYNDIETNYVGGKEIEEDVIFDKTIYDFATLELIPKESRAEYTLSTMGTEMARKFYNKELIDKMNIGVPI